MRIKGAFLRHAVLVWAACVLVFGQSDSKSKADSFADFRPRREMPKQGFAGREACAGCHKQKAKQYSQTGMAHALGGITNNRVLQSHPHLSFQAGAFLYEVTSDGSQFLYRVSDGKTSISEPIEFVFGNARVAQTYVLRHNGKLYEGRVSYYTKIDGLDWTIGDALNPPPTLEEAFGRDISGDEARNCFSCHGTSAVFDGKLQLDRLVPGVSCEACHGPGLSHAETMQLGPSEATTIFNPKTLGPDALDQEFCGACHRSADAVGMMPNLGGAENVRFQPYRLAGSRGHDPNDPQFACTACHDPHIDLADQNASADSKCTGCHSALSNAKVGDAAPAEKSKAVAKACPISNKGCDGCHMPKVEIPGTHFKFTDHRIRIARAGDKYPL